MDSPNRYDDEITILVPTWNRSKILTTILNEY